MNASQHKDYILVLLFVKYVSDKFVGQKDLCRGSQISQR
jgi:type I restriction enzyme M protein